MKFIQTSLSLFLIYFVTAGFVFPQDNAIKKDKSKDRKSMQKPIEVKANIMVLNAENKYVDVIKPEDLKVFEDGVEQKITYFAKKESVLNLGLVFDNSGSMREQLDEITMAGLTIISNLRPTDEAFAVRFISSDKIEVTQEWTSDKAKLKEAVANMFVEGGQSAVIDAIYLATQKILEREKENKSKRYALLLISDGEERDSYYKFEETFALFKNTDIQVFMLSYAENAQRMPKKSKNLSNRITLETGGTVYILSKKRTKDEIINALKAIVAELRSNYIIGYTSTNQNRDGLPRKLRVEVSDGAKGEKRQGIIREGLVVPKD